MATCGKARKHYRSPAAVYERQVFCVGLVGCDGRYSDVCRPLTKAETNRPLTPTYPSHPHPLQKIDSQARMWREGDLMRSRVPAPLTQASPRSTSATAAGAGAGGDSEGSARDSARSTPGTLCESLLQLLAAITVHLLGIHIPSQLTEHFSTTP